MQPLEFYKQIMAYFFDGSCMHISYFDTLKNMPALASFLGIPEENLASSHQIKRYFKKFLNKIYIQRKFRFILRQLFIWRLKQEQPSIIEIGVDTMVLDNNGALKREGCKPTYKNKLGFQPLQFTWNHIMIDAIFREGDKHSNHGKDVVNSLRRIVNLIRTEYKIDVPIIVKMDSGFFADENFSYMFMLIEAFSNHKQIQHYETFKIMQAVFEQQCSVKSPTDKVDNSEKAEEDNSNLSSKKKKKSVKKSKNKNKKKNGQIDQPISPENENNLNTILSDKSGKSNDRKRSIVELREKPVGDKIISSPHNTDAEYTKKRKQKIVGHKGFISETCNPNNKVQFITDVNLEKASFSDSEELENITDRLQKNELAPESFNLDAGFINGKTILSSAEKDINLIGPTAGHSQDSGKYDKDDHPYDISDFTVEIDDETKELTVISCPEGQFPQDQIRSETTDKILVHFSPECCDNCPSKGKCPVKIGKTVSTLTTDEAQYAGAKRHKIFMEDEEYRKSCAIRSGAESLVHEITAGHDCRKSRHRSEEGSRLQLIFGAIACNVKRFLHYMANSAQNRLCSQKLIIEIG